MNAGSFYEHSVACAKLLGYRAVLVLGKGNRDRMTSLSSEVISVEYAPFSKLFEQAAVVVHHGGVGTTGLAMRAGCPMLVVPCAWDQPDNGERATRLGVARTILRRRYTPARAAAAIQKLLDNRVYSERALEVREEVRQEDGVRVACDALEKLLNGA